MERIGLLGLGRMGQAIAGRLLMAGFPLMVYNRTPDRAATLVQQGAHQASSPADLAIHADVLLSILTDDNAVERVYRGAHGIFSADITGKLLIEMSTIRTDTIRALHRTAAEHGASMLDAPVSGTLEPARQGQLMTMVGGAAEDLERARPVLESFSRRIAHMGPAGAGTTMKLVLNMPMAIFWVALGEALAMGRQHGLELAAMLDIMLDSPVALPALRGKAPIMLGAPHEVAFDVTGVRKDLLAMIATAQHAGVPTPTGSAALAGFAAATAAGYGERDLAFVVEYLINVAAATYPPGAKEPA